MNNVVSVIALIIWKTDSSEIERTYKLRKKADSVLLSLFIRTNGKHNNSYIRLLAQA